MGAKFFLGLTCLCFIHSALSQISERERNISILVIGNAYYNDPGPFDSYEDINFSATQFLECFKGVAKPIRLLAAPDKLLTKEKILRAIQSFVTYVQQQKGKQNLGIIYYCGHGMTTKSGKMLWIPGNIESSIHDQTFDVLANKLLNVDDVYKIIIDTQRDQSNLSKFVILGDCCSSRIPSKWYDGIEYAFGGDSAATVTYDSAFLTNKTRPKTALDASAELTFDELTNPAAKNTDTGTTTINEVDFIGEMIRSRTMKLNGNLVYFSSAVGKVTDMVDHPEEDTTWAIGPICRRTLLYFRSPGSKSISAYLEKLTDTNFDKLTSPALLNRER